MRKKHATGDTIVMIGLAVVSIGYCLYGAIVGDLYFGLGSRRLHGVQAWCVAIAVVLSCSAVYVREYARTASRRRRDRREMWLLLAGCLFLAAGMWGTAVHAPAPVCRSIPPPPSQGVADGPGVVPEGSQDAVPTASPPDAG